MFNSKICSGLTSNVTLKAASRVVWRLFIGGWLRWSHLTMARIYDDMEDMIPRPIKRFTVAKFCLDNSSRKCSRPKIPAVCKYNPRVLYPVLVKDTYVLEQDKPSTISTQTGSCRASVKCCIYENPFIFYRWLHINTPNSP